MPTKYYYTINTSKLFICDRERIGDYKKLVSDIQQEFTYKRNSAWNKENNKFIKDHSGNRIGNVVCSFYKERECWEITLEVILWSVRGKGIVFDWSVEVAHRDDDKHPKRACCREDIVKTQKYIKSFINLRVASIERIFAKYSR